MKPFRYVIIAVLCFGFTKWSDALLQADMQACKALRDLIIFLSALRQQRNDDDDSCPNETQEEM